MILSPLLLLSKRKQLFFEVIIRMYFFFFKKALFSLILLFRPFALGTLVLQLAATELVDFLKLMINFFGKVLAISLIGIICKWMVNIFDRRFLYQEVG